MSDIATLTAAAADDCVKVAIELVSSNYVMVDLSQSFAECCKFSAKFKKIYPVVLSFKQVF